MFCKECGRQIPDNSNACQYCGTMLTQNPVNNTYNQANTNYQPQPMKQKKTPWKIIVSVMAVLLVIAIVIAVVVCGKKKDDAKLIEILEKHTDEPIVELICEDFDDNGEKEAYAVVGDSEEKEEYTEYIEADVYFVNQTEVEIIKEDVSGHSNGTIEVDDTIYVSFEIYDDEAETGYSYVYTAEENKPEEAEISGKYSDVHQDGMKIFATDVNGQIIEIELKPKENEKAEEETENLKNDFLEPTEKDWEKLEEFLDYTQLSYFSHNDTEDNHFDSESSDAVERAYTFVTGFYGYSQAYISIFGEDGKEEFWANEGIYEEKDPLGKFESIFSYFRYPADRIDWIIENVFNQVPDRTISAENYYYYGDYFYIAGGGAGDGEFSYKIEKTTALGNGKYEAEAYGYDAYDALSGVRAIATITVALKEVDGKHVWSFYTYEQEYTH